MFASKNNVELGRNLEILRLNCRTLEMRSLRSDKEKIAIEAWLELDGGIVMWNTMAERISEQ